MVSNPFWDEVRELICSYQMPSGPPLHFPSSPKSGLGPLNQFWPMEYEQRGCGGTSRQRQLRADASPSSFPSCGGDPGGYVFQMLQFPNRGGLPGPHEQRISLHYGKPLRF